MVQSSQSDHQLQNDPSDTSPLVSMGGIGIKVDGWIGGMARQERWRDSMDGCDRWL